MSTARARRIVVAALVPALLGALGVALIVVVAPQPSVASAVCARSDATGMKFVRKRGLRYGRLTWPAAGRHHTYRVFRNGVVVGQTRRRSMPVRVKAGRMYSFAVRVVRSTGVMASCVGNLRQRVRWFAPARTRKPVVRKTGATTVRLRWRPARLGDGPLAAYRVYRNGRIQRQVHGRSARVRLATGATYRMQIAAVDTQGQVGPPSRPAFIRIGHQPPGTPGGLYIGTVTDTQVSLSWGGSPGGTARIVGYRLYRNGALVRQVAGLSTTVGNLAPATDYSFTVAAVDSRGYVGPTAPAVGVRTAMPPPTDGKLHAFMLASTDASFEALQRSYRRIGTLYPTYFNCWRGSANWGGKDDPLVTGWAKLRRLPVMPRFNCQHQPTLHLILTNPAARETSIASLVSIARQYGYEGVNLDFESGAADDAMAFVQYAAELARRLHAEGRKLSLEVSAKYDDFITSRNSFYRYRGLSAVADHVFVMSWGFHWTSSAPGSTDDLPLVHKVADYVASMPNKKRFIMGAPLYGMDWPAGGGPSHPGTALHHSEVMALVARYGARPRLDPTAYSWTFKYTDAAGIGHEVWFSDRTTVAARMQLAREHGLGFGVWRVGQEDPGIWDLPLMAPSYWP
jgi:spore germination protein YaaH